MTSPNSQKHLPVKNTLLIPLKFNFDNKKTKSSVVIDNIGESMIKNISISIGNDSYEWEPLEGCGFKVKGPRLIEWRCACGYSISDSMPPNICPICHLKHEE